RSLAQSEKDDVVEVVSRPPSMSTPRKPPAPPGPPPVQRYALDDGRDDDAERGGGRGYREFDGQRRCASHWASARARLPARPSALAGPGEPRALRGGGGQPSKGDAQNGAAASPAAPAPGSQDAAQASAHRAAQNAP
ncbi:unnamed protein product, partial [Prorocentrum cordatum]